MNASCALHTDTTATGTCPRCGNFTCGQCERDDAQRCPACVKLVGASSAITLPWERRAELGIVKAFVEQIKLAVMKPGQYVAAITPGGSWREPFFFGWLVSAAIGVLSIPYNAFSFWSRGEQMKQSFDVMGNSDFVRGLAGVYELIAAHPVIAAVVTSAYTFAIYPLMFFVNSGSQQLGLALAGVNPREPISATMRVNGYSHAANVLLAIPVVGGLAAIYTVVIQIWALRTVHKTTTFKAIVAGLWLGVLLGCCAGVLVVAAAVKLISSIR